MSKESGTAAQVSATISPLAPKDGFPRLPVVKGVSLAAASAGIKYRERKDTMLATVTPGSVLAGVFTRSGTRSAPVLDCQAKLARHMAAPVSKHGFAILANSGNANAFTGHRGEGSVEAICNGTSRLLGIPVENIFTASTGVIGERLSHERILKILSELKTGLSGTGMREAAGAILTTDTYPKGSGTGIAIEGREVSIAGMAKGSGMISPDMATMLSFVFTDARVSQPVLQAILNEVNDSTFNAISVDGDTSTSDTLIVAATGRSGISEISDAGSPAGRALAGAMHKVMKDLALQVVRDGEGATKFIEINVTGADAEDAARQVARSIGNSLLVKTAVAGEDPNWGRIVMAVGKSGAAVDRDRLSISFGDIIVAENGWVSDRYSEEAGQAYMRRENIVINVDLGIGSASSTFWTCDLTQQYVVINADYRS